ncbi:MAG: TerB family tellurite resistance protein [Candidatus Atelocyanobacterium thalassa]
MNRKYKNKQLLKILIGVAWIDGIIQMEERNYLKYILEYHGLSKDIELQYFLSELKPIKANQCYQWLEEYLGNNPTREDYQELLESLSALIYSDGDIQIQEAQLLNKLQFLDPSQNYYQLSFARTVKILQKMFRNAIDKIVQD